MVFLPIEKYGQMAGGSYTVVTNHKKYWLGLKIWVFVSTYKHWFEGYHTLSSLWNSICIIFVINYLYEILCFWYFIFLFVPWVKNVTKWMCRTFETFGFLYWKHASLISIWNLHERVIFFFFVDSIIHLINLIYYYL